MNKVDRRQRGWLWPALLASILIACAIIGGYQVDGAAPLVEVEAIGTGTPNGYRAGLCDVRNFSTTVTPAPGQVCSGWDIYASTAQPNLTTTPDWGPARTRVSYLATQALASAPGLQFFESNGSGTDVVRLPQGVPTVAYTAGSCVEVAPNYAASIFQDWYDSLVVSYCSWANTDPKISVIPLQLGVSGETANTYAETATCGANKQQALERIIGADAYKAWVKRALTTWRTYCPNKAMTFATHLGSVYSEGGDGGWRGARTWLPYLYPMTPTPGAPQPGAVPQPTPIYGVMPRQNGLKYGDPNGYNWGSGNAPWGRLRMGQYAQDYTGAAYETYYSRAAITAIPTVERVGDLRDMTLAALGPGNAANLFYQFSSGGECGWDCYVDSWLAKVITSTAGLGPTKSPMAWVRFRDAEYPQAGGSGYEMSDWPGPYTHLVSVSASHDPVRKCWASVKARATPSAYATPAICSTTQAVTGPESRYTLEYPAGTTISVDLADGWAFAGRFDRSYTFSLTYRNSGTDTLTVAYQNAAGASATRTITKTNTGAMLTETWTATAAFFNGLNDADAEIRTGTGADELSWFSVETSASTPAPTATATKTTSPTWTRPPTKTVTPGGPTATATATNTPAAAGLGTLDAGPAASTYLWRDDPDDAHSDAIEYAAEDAAGASGSWLATWPGLAKPPDATYVQRATLTLWVVSSSGQPPTLEARRSLRAWGTGATWNGTGVDGGGGWEVAGAFGGTDRASTATAGAYTWSGLPVTVTLDVTAAVGAWLDQGQTNYGLVVQARACGCEAWAGIAGDGYADASKRPQLSVTFGYVSATPTRTPTASATPTLPPAQAATWTPSVTPTGTRTPSPTPLPGLKINEVCAWPDRDLNLDGYVNTSDRAVELFNPGSTAIDLAGYALEFVPGDPGMTYTLPRFTLIGAAGYKAIYGYQLRNAYGNRFWIPGGQVGAWTVRLFAPGGRQPVDQLTYSGVALGLCWARWPNGGPTWSWNRGPTIGGPN